MTRARKPRQPTTIEDALARAYELLGIDVAERVTQRSRSALWAMSDPARAERPNDLVMVALDRALQEIGEPPVIRATYDILIGGDGPKPGESIDRITLGLGKALGALQGAVLQATDPQSCRGRGISPNEWAEIARHENQIEGALHKLKALRPDDDRPMPRVVGS